MNMRTIIFIFLPTVFLVSCRILSNNTVFNGINSNNVTNNNNILNNGNKYIWKIYDKKDSLTFPIKFLKSEINGNELWHNTEIENFNSKNEFSVTINTQAINPGNPKECINVQWGDIKSAKKLYKLCFSIAGDVRLDYFDKIWSNVYKASYNPSNISKTHNFDIIQKKDSCLVYINNVKVLSEPIKVIEGKTIGIQQWKQSIWDISIIELKQNN